jgi:hypothetical protein
MVIKLFDAAVANGAMGAARWAVEMARSAILGDDFVPVDDVNCCPPALQLPGDLAMIWDWMYTGIMHEASELHSQLHAIHRCMTQTRSNLNQCCAHVGYGSCIIARDDAWIFATGK